MDLDHLVNKVLVAHQVRLAPEVTQVHLDPLENKVDKGYLDLQAQLVQQAREVKLDHLVAKDLLDQEVKLDLLDQEGRQDLLENRVRLVDQVQVDH